MNYGTKVKLTPASIDERATAQSFGWEGKTGIVQDAPDTYGYVSVYWKHRGCTSFWQVSELEMV